MLVVNKRTGKKLSKKYVAECVLEQADITAKMVINKDIPQVLWCNFCESNKLNLWVAPKERLIKYLMDNNTLARLGELDSKIKEFRYKYEN